MIYALFSYLPIRIIDALVTSSGLLLAVITDTYLRFVLQKLGDTWGCRQSIVTCSSTAVVH